MARQRHTMHHPQQMISIPGWINLAQRTQRVAWASIATIACTLIAWAFSLGARVSAVETAGTQTQQRVERVERQQSEDRTETRRQLDQVLDLLRSMDQRTAWMEGKMGRK